MPPSLELQVLHHPTSNILALENPLQPGKEDISVPDDTDASSYLLSPSIHDTLVPDTESWALLRASNHDILLLAGIVVMLVWPWIFLAMVWVRGGIQMNNYFAAVVIAHPQTISFFATLLGSIVSIIIGTLFSIATVRFAQEWVTNNDHVTVFHISLISAFRHQNLPWGLKDRKYLLIQGRWLLVVLVGACIAAFAAIPSGTTSLIAPVPFHRTVPLTGTELDFSSSAADCIGWFGENNMDNCDWKTINGLNYTTCRGGSQVVDLLEPGRSNMRLLISNTSDSFALASLGAHSGLHFLGPMRGVLPIGFNSLPGIDTLQPSPLSDAQTKAVIRSYNYTLDHQGLDIKIGCTYDKQSPIRYSPMPPGGGPFVMITNGTCDGLANVSTGDIPTSNTNYTLTFWACKSLPTGEEDPVYYIYLRGRVFYEAVIGNITCTVSPIRPAIFPVMYQSSTDIFRTKDQITTSDPAKPFSGFIENALQELGAIVWDAQSLGSNRVAETVVAFGFQFFGLSPNKKNEQYLRLYEAMIQGILVDQVTYTRFIYSTITGPPSSCIRTVSGSLSAEVIGWFAKPVHIGFLTPMTIINLASLIIILMTISRAKEGCYEFDPTDPRPLALAESSIDEFESSGWADAVTYRPREWLKTKVSE